MMEVIEPHYTLIKTSRGKKPALVVVNSALRNFPRQHDLPWHLKIVITCRDLAEQGMPTADENQVLYSIEDSIAAEILADNNGMFLARITCDGRRELVFRMHDADIAAVKLQHLVSTNHAVREWEYRMEEDPDWRLPQPELQLLVKDPRFN
jgi:hypothetical protein